MTNCIFVTATLFQTLAFIATGIAFFAPFWREEGQTGTGLWGTCTSSECTWFWEDNYTWGKELTDWEIAVMALYGVGFLIVFIAELYSRLQLCCDVRASMSRAGGFLLIAAFLLMGVAIGVYGGMTNKEEKGFDTDCSDNKCFGWAYWMAVAGCILTLITALMYVCITGCRCKD